MRFKRLLEAKQVGTLYHFRALTNAFDIIKSNELKVLKSSKTPSISFTRNKNFGKSKRLDIQTNFAFIVDGNKLSNKYKIESYSDPQIKNWGYEREQEERILTKKIPNFLSYVKGILIDKDGIEKTTKAFSSGIISKHIFGKEFAWTLDDIIKKLKDKNLKVILK